ncbi:carbohydrate sulfotransferase 12-like [Antedon mediterranea]|uniref:carbohydrate sulfotransferase 12-like n=1 Tax=Antedon mediterranea TaxID=105859 RepID=UPI003AF5B348
MAQIIRLKQSAIRCSLGFVVLLIISSVFLYNNSVSNKGTQKRYRSRHPQPVVQRQNAPVIVKHFMKNCSVEECTFEEVQRERQLNIWRVCNGDQYKETNNSYFARHRFDHLYYVNKSGIVFCAIPKATSTTLKRLLLISSKIYANVESMPLDVHRVFNEHSVKLSDLTKPDILNIFKNSTKIMVVRNPFTRLLSAFRDKLEPEWADEFFPRSIFIEKIQDKYGLEKGNSLSFKEFVRYVSDFDNTFPNDFEEHWREMYKLCLPCEVKYDVIEKFENIYDKKEYNSLMKLLNISGVLPPKSTHGTNSSSQMMVEKYYSNLSEDLVYSIYQRYLMDFKLFSYNL